MSSTSDVSIGMVQDFAQLFAGNKQGHGILVLQPPAENADYGEKRYGKATTAVDDPVTDSLYQRHLEGIVGLGISPIDKENKVSFSVLDIDLYGQSYEAFQARVLANIYELNLPLVPFRSKSGGIHVYMFYTSPIKATEARFYMKEFRNLLCLEKATEIFPKQGKIEKDAETGKEGIGSWINLPYFDVDHTDRPMIDKSGQGIPFSTAVGLIKAKKMSKAGMDAFLKSLEMSDAPPCLQALYLTSGVEKGSRNLYLFNMAQYFKKKLGDKALVDEAIKKVNNALSHRLDLDEVNRTVAKSYSGNAYSYKCAEAPIISVCDAEACKLREFGKKENIVSLDWGALVKIMSVPPEYEWIIEGKRIYIGTVDMVMNMAYVMGLCAVNLGKVPYIANRKQWITIVNESLKANEVKEVDAETDISSGAELMRLLANFCIGRSLQSTKQQIGLGRVYINHEKQRYEFRADAFKSYLEKQVQFRDFSMGEVRSMLEGHGLLMATIRISAQIGTAKVWTMPLGSIEHYRSNSLELVDINSIKTQQEDPDEDLDDIELDEATSKF